MGRTKKGTDWDSFDRKGTALELSLLPFYNTPLLYSSITGSDLLTIYHLGNDDLSLPKGM